MIASYLSHFDGKLFPTNTRSPNSFSLLVTTVAGSIADSPSKLVVGAAKSAIAPAPPVSTPFALKSVPGVKLKVVLPKVVFVKLGNIQSIGGASSAGCPATGISVRRVAENAAGVPVVNATSPNETLRVRSPK